MSIEAELVAVKEEVKIKEECDDELLDILPSTSKLIPEDDKEAIQASLKIDPEQDLKFLAGTSQGDSEYDCFEEKQFKMENVEPEEGITSEDEDQSDSESEDLSDEGPPKIKSEELIIKSESAVDSDARREHNHFRDLNENGMVKEQKCDYCPFICKNKDDLKVHMLEYCEEIGKMHACPLCSYKTIYKFQLKNHVLARHDKKSIKKHKCEYCNFKSSYKCSLLKHVSSIHSATSTETYVCGYCDYTNNNSYLLKKHIWKMHKEETVNTYSCDYCNFVTRKATILRRHKLCQHQRQTSKRYACNQCEYNTQYRGILIKHGLKVHKLAPTDDQSNLGKISITLL